MRRRNVKDALYDAEVLEAFRLSAARAKKSSRGGGAAEAKSSIEEFERLLEAVRVQASGEEAPEGEELLGESPEHSEDQLRRPRPEGVAF